MLIASVILLDEQMNLSQAKKKSYKSYRFS